MAIDSEKGQRPRYLVDFARDTEGVHKQSRHEKHCENECHQEKQTLEAHVTSSIADRANDTRDGAA